MELGLSELLPQRRGSFRALSSVSVSLGKKQQGISSDSSLPSFWWTHTQAVNVTYILNLVADTEEPVNKVGLWSQMIIGACHFQNESLCQHNLTWQRWSRPRGSHTAKSSSWFWTDSKPRCSRKLLHIPSSWSASLTSGIQCVNTELARNSPEKSAF